MSSLTGEESGYWFDEEERKQLWWIGALIYALGSVLINLGSNLIRKDHSLAESIESNKPQYLRILWVLGFAVFGFGNVLNFIAFMFAAQSLLAALGSIQFVTNIFFAAMINKEPVTIRAVVATCIIITGNIIIIIFGSKATENYNLEELKQLALDRLFLGYLLCIYIIVYVLQMIYLYFQWKIDTCKDPPYYMLQFQPFAYATVSAIIGTNTIIFGKICAGLLQNAVKGEPVFSNVWTYVILGVFALTMIFWLYRMNNALRMYDAMFIIPVLQCVWLLFGVIGGVIFFKEYEDMTNSEATMFAVGVVILLIGISTLRPSVRNSYEEDSTKEMELDTIQEGKKHEQESLDDISDKEIA